MADALLGKTEVDAASAELISSIVQQFLIQESKLLSTVSDYSALAVPGSDTVKFPKAAGFTVGDKAENTAVDAQVMTYATDDLLLNKHKVVQVLVEKFAKLQGPQSLEADIALRAAKGLALQLDIDIITALEAASASGPDHRIAYIGATIAKEDILAARTLLNKQVVPMEDRYLVISPDSESSLLALADFIHAQTYGDANSLKSGELGRIYGFTVMMHNNAATLKTLAYHKSHVAAAIQQGMVYDSDKDLANLAMRHSFDQVYGVKTMDAGKRGVLLGTAT